MGSGPGTRTSLRLAALLSAGVVIVVGMSGEARAGFQTGILEPDHYSLDPETRTWAFDTTEAVGAGILRFNVSWRTVAARRPTDASNPFDPAYNFERYDNAIREASARGLDVMLTVTSAPDYAQAPDRPHSDSIGQGAWRPDPAEYGSFAEAVATRYSGTVGLPRVRYYQAWNEPNLPQYIAPQWEGNKPVGPEHYRQMLNRFYDAVKNVAADNVVITGGNSPYGDDPGGARMRPLRFDRELLCLSENLKPLPNCEPARFDIFADHPITTGGGPTVSAIHPDDVSTGDFRNVRRVVRAAERVGTVGGPKRHPLWATEIWWESNPPDPVYGVPLKRHARWTAEAMYELWKQGAERVFFLFLRDRVDVSTGLFFADRVPKPAAQAFSFPFVTERKSKRNVNVWGISPTTGKVAVQRFSGGRWRTLTTLEVRAGVVFAETLPMRGGGKLRAKVGGEKSLVWSQRG